MRSTNAAVRAFRAAQRERPRRPFEALTGPDTWRPGTVRRAERQLAADPAPVDWRADARTSRSDGYRLHALDGIAPLLAAHDGTGDDRFLDAALAVALDWVEHHPEPGEAGFAWYDMAVGLRAHRLGYLLDAAARDEARDDEVVGALLRSVRQHALVLARDDGYAGHSNHGLYQAAGQLSLARRFPSVADAAAGGEQAERRVRDFVDVHFTTEGVHREHSPAYHWMVTQTLVVLTSSGLLDDDGIVRRVDAIQDALAWFVLPDGRFVPFGDTDPARVARARTSLASPALRHAVSCGADGTAPPEPVRAFPESGYWVVRDGGSLVALNAAFHSTTHKHADDLSFVWFDRGRDLLVDPGRYGYEGRVEPGTPLSADGFWYDDPNRIYVESTRAHNTVEIDGRNSARRIEPYGSALRSWDAVDGHFLASAAVRHFGTVEHARTLVHRPGSFGLVLDRVEDPGEAHDLALRFHLAPDLGASAPSDDGVVTVALPGRDERLWIVPLAPTGPAELVRGRPPPDQLGWWSPSRGAIEPCWTVTYRATAVHRQRFATLLCLGRDAPSDAVLDSGEHDADRARWAQDGTAHDVHVAVRPAGGGQ